jgi:hypothetical protein
MTIYKVIIINNFVLFMYEKTLSRLTSDVFFLFITLKYNIYVMCHVTLSQRILIFTIVICSSSINVFRSTTLLFHHHVISILGFFFIPANLILSKVLA